MAPVHENNPIEPNLAEERNTPPAFLDLADSVRLYLSRFVCELTAPGSLLAGVPILQLYVFRSCFLVLKW